MAGLSVVRRCSLSEHRRSVCSVGPSERARSRVTSAQLWGTCESDTSTAATVVTARTHPVDRHRYEGERLRSVPDHSGLPDGHRSQPAHSRVTPAAQCRCDAGPTDIGPQCHLRYAPQRRTKPVEPTRNQRILVVDDEPSIVDAVATSLRYEGFDVEEAIDRAAGPVRRPGEPTRPDRARRHAPRPRRAGGHPPPARRRHPGPHPLPHGPRRRRGQGGRADRGRGRLRDQALRPGRDRGPGPRHPAPDGSEDRGRGHPAVRRHRDGRERPRGTRAGQPIAADGHRVQPASLLPPQSAPGAVEGPDPRQRLALRLRRGRQRGRDLRQLPAQEARGHGPPVIHTVRLVGYAFREPAQPDRSVSLRPRLLLAIGVIALVALAIADVVTYPALQSFLYHRIDQQLEGGHVHYRVRPGQRVSCSRAPVASDRPREPAARAAPERPARRTRRCPTPSRCRPSRCGPRRARSSTPRSARPTTTATAYTPKLPRRSPASRPGQP